MILAGLIAARFTHYLALALLLGGASFALFAGSGTDPAGEGSGLRRRLQLVLFWAGLATFASAAAVLAFTAANLAGAMAGAVDPATLGTILADTDFGRVWAFRLLLALALTGFLALQPRGAGALWAVLLGAGALTVTVALTGHAQIRTGPIGWAHRAGDAAHLTAAAVWLGALPPFLHCLRRSNGAGGQGALAAGRLLQRFHAVGLAAVLVLIVSGLINSFVLVGDPARLVTTAYGRLLTVKLALFAGMVLLAADNRLRLVPRLNQALAEGLPPAVWLGRLRGRVRAEFALGLGVLGAVAALGVLAPAADASIAG